MTKENGILYLTRLLKEKSALKQEVFHTTILVFEKLKEAVSEVTRELKPIAERIDKRLVIDYKEKGPFEIELKAASDILLFHMHTNVFHFDKSHPIWRTHYVREDEKRAYCGIIHIYDFLADSFKYNRTNDIGYLIARLFINYEQHYFIEGKRQLGFLYNDFVHNIIDATALRKIVESVIIYALEFDLYVPPFEEMKEVSVSEILEASQNMRIRTGKRLGFRFQADTDRIE